MIAYQVALLAWIIVSFLLMIDRNSARGFSLAYVLGMVLLPAGAVVDLPAVPDLDKMNVAGLGVLAGTIAFHPQLFDRYKFSIPDLLLLGLMGFSFLTSIVNGFGPYDGASSAAGIAAGMVLPFFLARLHLGTMQGIRTFLLTLVAGGCAMAPFALYEFRMSPQLHTFTYGYFQHQFGQHFRGGFWRPILFFSHALALGRFFALAAFLALLPMRRDLVAQLGPVGGFAFLLPLLGLLLSQSYGPYLFFVMLCLGYFLMRRHHRVVILVPILAFTWLLVNMAGGALGYGVVQQVRGVNQERAASLQYRLDALQEYRSVIWSRPLFGHGGWDHGRIHGRATDSQALISLLNMGYLGTTILFAWWFSMMGIAFSVARRTQGSRFGQRASAIAVLLALVIGVTTIDAALDLHLLLLAGGLVPIYHWLRARGPVHPRTRPTQAPAGLPA
jgi:hypothetical protein